MELSDVSTRHRHHQGRRSKHQNGHRKYGVARTTQSFDSGHKGSATLRPTRVEHPHDGDKHGLVDTWLDDIATLQLQPAHKNETMSQEPQPESGPRPRSTYRMRSPSPSRLFSFNSHNGQVFEASLRQRLRERKRPRDLVQDDSVIGLCDEQGQVRVQTGPRPVLPATESNHESGKERSLVGSEGSVVSVTSEGQYHFAKKARRKTRSDRYETTRDHKPRKPGKKKKKKPGDQSKRDENRRVGDFTSAREVMENFNSKSILSNRITMQPILGPGLFDNGRASKDQLPDLTFHEMHFLKRPPPPKPVPRDRERAKRRGERELEEVSAFFLHKGMPEASSGSGRDHPAMSGASSLDRATRDSSAFGIDAPPRHSRPGDEYVHRSPDMDRESSRAATTWTRSSSCAAPERRTTQANGAREHVPAKSSTPSPTQNALGRPRDTENAGGRCVERSRQVLRATSHTKTFSSTREPLAVVSTEIVNRQPDMSGQNVRIVRYHDRGVMASEEAENAAGCYQKGTGARPDAVEQPRRGISAKSPAFKSIVKCSRFGPEDRRVNPTQGEGEVCVAGAVHAADHDSVPDRPRSPKYTMVQQLEAAVENSKFGEFQNDPARGFTSLPAHGGGQSASTHYSHHIPGAHSASQDGRFEIEPRFVGDGQQHLFEAAQQNNTFYAIDDELRDSQRDHEANLAQQIASGRTSGNSYRISNLDQPAYDVPSAQHRPSGARSMAHYALGRPPGVPMIPPNGDPGSQTVMHDWAATGQGQLLSDQFFSREQSMSPEAADMSSQIPDRQQSLKEYIAQMEHEVFCRPQDADVDDSPISRWNGVQEDHEVYWECTSPSPLNPKVDAYDQDLLGGGHLRDQSIGGSYYGGGSAMHDPDVDEEEQRFVSTFWRPNCY